MRIGCGHNGLFMSVSYKKLWHLLIDREMNKSDLQRLSGISWSALSKQSKKENVKTDVLVKICSVMQCDIADIMEIRAGVKSLGNNFCVIAGNKCAVIKLFLFRKTEIRT